MATGDIKIDEGSTTNLPTYTYSEDAETKELPRSALNNSSGVEIGTAANPVVMSGVVNGVVQAIVQNWPALTTISGNVGGTVNAIIQNALSITGVVTTSGTVGGTVNVPGIGTRNWTLASGIDFVNVGNFPTQQTVNGFVTTSGTVGGTIQSIVQNFPNYTASGVQHTVVDNFPAVQNVTENNSSAILAKLPSQGQATMSASQPVAVASNQSPFPVYRGTTTYSGTQALPEFRTFANVSASQTDSSLVAAISGKIIRVVAFVSQAGGTATNLTFNSKGGGAGTAISMTFQNGANSGEVAPENIQGWFQTNVGEGLTVTTGAGSTTGVQVTYVVV